MNKNIRIAKKLVEIANEIYVASKKQKISPYKRKVKIFTKNMLKKCEQMMH